MLHIFAFKKKSLFKTICICMLSLCEFVHIHVVPAETRRRSDSLGLELWAAVSCLMWVLGTARNWILSSARLLHTLNHWAISPAPRKLSLNWVCEVKDCLSTGEGNQKGKRKEKKKIKVHYHYINLVRFLRAIVHTSLMDEIFLH